MRLRGVKIGLGLAGVSGDCSRVDLVPEGRSDERRYCVAAAAEVSIAVGILAPLGLVEFETAGDDEGMDEGNDCRLVRAMRDCRSWVSLVLQLLAQY